MNSEEYARYLVDEMYSKASPDNGMDYYEAIECAKVAVIEMQKLQINNPQNWGATGVYFQMVLNELQKL